jgi:hypothetical protein
MTARNYKIKITREGQEFEAEGDKAFVLKMLERFDTAGVSDSTATKPTSKRASARKAALRS